MDYLDILRRLVDQQQFALLKTNAEAYLQETVDTSVLPLLALAYAHLGERQATERVLLQLDAERVALDRDARVDLAAVQIITGRMPLAIAGLEAVLMEQPDHSLALARLAYCRMQQDQTDEAHLLYQRAAALAPHRLPVWSALARLQLQAGEIATAQRVLETGITQLEAGRTTLSELAVVNFTTQFRELQLEIWIAAEQMAQAEQWLEMRRESLSEEEWVGLVLSYAALLAGRDHHTEAEGALRAALKHYSKNLSLFSQLAEFAQLQGRTRQAVHLLRRALVLAKAQNKPEITFWVRLSEALLHTNDAQARTAAEKAIELAEALQESDTATPMEQHFLLRLKAKNALAQVESQTQHFEEAEKLFGEVLKENAWFLPALQGLGHQQVQRGRIDDAVALFERIKAINPASGYASLINLRQFPSDEKTLAHMEKLAYQPSLEGSTRSGLLFRLAAAWEHRKDYDKAMELAYEANTASKKSLHYDPKAHRQRCARIRHAFPRALYEHRQGVGLDTTLPVYVVGMPRSGTTLVEQIIAGHSQIFGAGELGTIPQVIAGLERWERHTGSGRHYPDCIDDLNRYTTQGIAKNLLKELQEYAPDAKHVVDKMPHNFENIGLIKFLFPKARIISVRRDPRDIAISNYFTDYQAKHGGMGFAYDLTWIGEQLADHNLLMHDWHQLFPNEILEISYEEVIENTEEMARKMLDYIGVEWEPQVLAFNTLDRPVKTASVWQVRQPIYKSSKAKWKRYQAHLKPLIQGTNAKITWDSIDMITLPEPGLLTDGVEMFRQDKLDEAELSLKKMLHHNPDHAAANYMVGLIYLRKNHMEDGIKQLVKALDICPWQGEWRSNLIKAYEVTGQQEKAKRLIIQRHRAESEDDLSDSPLPDVQRIMTSSPANVLTGELAGGTI